MCPEAQGRTPRARRWRKPRAPRPPRRTPRAHQWCNAGRGRARSRHRCWAVAKARKQLTRAQGVFCEEST
eukprot:10381250-Alexandrium_andersonii.AAC.1